MRLLPGFFLVSWFFNGVEARPAVYPTGTTIYDPHKAYNCYVAFGGPDGRTHIVDMDGHEVKRWESSGFPSLVIDPELAHGQRGHVLVQLTHGDSPPRMGYIFANKSIGELDWDGNAVWEWSDLAPGGAARQNHDIARLPNGNTLVLANNDRIVPALSSKTIGDQAFYEVSPDGKIVWKWLVGDHVSEFGFSSEGMALFIDSLRSGGEAFLTINDMKPLGPNKWFASGDKRFAPDNILFGSREGSFIAIVEKTTGKVVWRLGPDFSKQATNDLTSNFASIIDLRPGLSRTVPRPLDQLSGQHDAYMIPIGLPGAGNILVFDNEGPSGFPPTHLGVNNGSRVIEINPITRQIVWQYSGLDSDSPLWSFYSSFISSARRLPNGNTLIDEGQEGRFIQVTPQGEIVWEYVNPYYGRQIMGAGKEANTNWVYRAQPVPYDWLPAGTPHSETPIPKIDNSTFRVPGAP